jgi:hypothetical protein
VIRSLLVLSAVLRGGGLPCKRTQMAGVDALVARPAGGGPAVVVANAATPRGIDEPAVGRLLGGLARAGFVAIAPELPRVRDGEVTPATVDALVDVARGAGPRTALLGVSTGAGLAILAAGDLRLREQVSAVLAIAPFASLERILLLGTTGFYNGNPFPAEPLMARATMRSVAASAPDDPGVPALLSNRDPDRFEELFAALTPRTRQLVSELSPASRIALISAPVELLSDPDDAFFPADESRALASAGGDVRLTVTHALEHVRPRRRLGLVHVVAALDRTLRRAAEAETTAIPVLRPSPAL